MSNAVRVEKTPVQLDKERNLLYDLNAYCELEEHFGSQRKALEALASGSMKAIRTFLYIGLRHEDEDLTEAQVGSMLSPVDAVGLAEKILLASSNSMPKAKN